MPAATLAARSCSKPAAAECRGSPRARSRSASLLRPFFRRSRSPRARRCSSRRWRRCCARARFSWSPRKSPPARTRDPGQGPRAHARAAAFAQHALSGAPRGLRRLRHCLAAVFSVALLFWAPPLQVALWGLSLALEAALVAAAALFRHDAAHRRRRHRRRGGPLSARAPCPAIQALADTPLAAERRGRDGSRAARSTPSPSCCPVWTPRRGPGGWSTRRRRSPSTARRWPRSRSTSSCGRCRAIRLPTPRGATRAVPAWILLLLAASLAAQVALCGARPAEPRRRAAAAGAFGAHAAARGLRRDASRGALGMLYLQAIRPGWAGHARLAAWLRALISSIRAGNIPVRRGARLCRTPGPCARPGDAGAHPRTIPPRPESALAVARTRRPARQAAAGPAACATYAATIDRHTTAVDVRSGQGRWKSSSWRT